MEEHLKSLLDTFSKIPTRAEFVAAFKELTELIASALLDVNKRVDAKLASVRDGRDGKDGKSIKGDKGDKGERGDKGAKGDTFIALRGERGEDGKDGSPDTAEQVRDKLETLEDEERLDAKHIKNLPEFIERNRDFIGPLALSFLMDVDVAGITAGQSIEWDGVKWKPFTPSGSGGTPVWGEALESQDPTGSVFTLASTPLAGSLRLFRGGAYQRITDDYTLAGDTITLTNALQSGELLTADYSS